MIPQNIDIDYSPNEGFPKFKPDLGRINVILGANGSGKSKLLKRLSTMKFYSDLSKKPIYFEGGRSIRTNFASFNSHQHDYTNYESTLGQYNVFKNQELTTRINSTIILLGYLREKEYHEFRENYKLWENAGGNGDLAP